MYALGLWYRPLSANAAYYPYAALANTVSSALRGLFFNYHKSTVRMKKFVIVEAENKEDFETACKAAAESGLQPIGQLCVTCKSGSHTLVYSQQWMLEQDKVAPAPPTRKSFFKYLIAYWND